MSDRPKRADMIVHEQQPYNAEPPPAALSGRPLTPLDTFYTRNHGEIPQADASWRVRVDGLVDRPVDYSLAELRERFAEHSVTATMQCAGNNRAGFLAVRDIPGEDPWGVGATSTARWTGVRLADVLRAAEPQAGAGHVGFEAPDVSELARPAQPYGGSIPLAKALSEEVLLAWAMNGEPLPALHGAPLRVVVPGWIGARSVKWLRRISVLAEPSQNYFQARAYWLLPADADPDQADPAESGAGFSLGPIALNSAILTPADGAELAAGPVVVTGYAFAGQDRRVARVDVSADGGVSWQQAELDEPDGDWAWTLWRTTVTGAPGELELTARAWDNCAALQPESAAQLWNPKGYVNNSWPRVRVRVRDSE